VIFIPQRNSLLPILISSPWAMGSNRRISRSSKNLSRFKRGRLSVDFFLCKGFVLGFSSLGICELPFVKPSCSYAGSPMTVTPSGTDWSPNSSCSYRHPFDPWIQEGIVAWAPIEQESPTWHRHRAGNGRDWLRWSFLIWTVMMHWAPVVDHATDASWVSVQPKQLLNNHLIDLLWAITD